MPRLTIAAGDDRALGKSRRDFRARVCSSLENAATYRECLLLSLSLSLSLSLDRSIDRSIPLGDQEISMSICQALSIRHS